MSVHTDAELDVMFDELVARYAPRGAAFGLEVILTSSDDEYLEDGQRGLFRTPGLAAELEVGRDADGVFAFVFIRRERGGKEPTTALDELITLGHELGHWQSWREGRHGADYRDMTERQPCWPQCDVTDRELVAREERRAWRYGASFLSAVGFRDAVALADRRRADLAVYEELLAMAVDVPDEADDEPPASAVEDERASCLVAED